MPPLSLTQLKYASAMLAPSVKSVPGCLVTIAPTLIGVPVAFVPGFVPHLVTSEAFFAVVELPPPPPDDVLLLLSLPHAATSTDRPATSATSASACRHLRSQPKIVLTSDPPPPPTTVLDRLVRQAHSCTKNEPTRSTRAPSRRLYRLFGGV